MLLTKVFKLTYQSVSLRVALDYEDNKFWVCLEDLCRCWGKQRLLKGMRQLDKSHQKVAYIKWDKPPVNIAIKWIDLEGLFELSQLYHQNKFSFWFYNVAMPQLNRQESQDGVVYFNNLIELIREFVFSQASTLN